jgi:hypothetical protein
MTPWDLFIDDERFPPADNRSWRIARTRDEAIQLILEYGMPRFISFDHDLGDDTPTGHDIAQTLVEMDLDGRIDIPEKFEYYVHSQNPVGRQNIDALLKGYLAFKDKQKS